MLLNLIKILYIEACSGNEDYVKILTDTMSNILT
jgi:hypothetical protein